MNAMIADLKSAQKALVLAPATLTYAVAGKSVVSGVTASGAKVTVTVDGKTYSATADDVTGAFTVATSALKKTSTIKVDATRNGVNGTYSYAMKNGDIESGIVPTSPVPPTQPTTSSSAYNSYTANNSYSADCTYTAYNSYRADYCSCSEAHSKRYFKLLWFCIKDSKH